jgi:transporter family-2 protein
MPLLSYAFLLTICFTGGAFLAAQGPILARLGAYAGGPFQAAIVAFTVGLSVLIVVTLAQGLSMPRIEGLKAMPLWVWASGLIGTVMLMVTLYAVPRIGVAPFVACSVTGQLASAVVLDHVGAFGVDERPVSLRVLLGVSLLLAGMLLIVLRPQT